MIITPDQPTISLSPRGSAERTPDTYARAAAPPPADTSIGDALKTLAGVANSIDDDKAAKDKELAGLYQAQLSAAMQGQTGFVPAVADGVLNSVHPRVRAYVTEQYGRAKGEEAYRAWSNSAEGSTPPNAITDPAAYEAWKAQATAAGLSQAGTANLWYRAGFTQAFNAAASANGKQIDKIRNAEAQEFLINRARENLAKAAQGDTPVGDPTRAPDPDKARAIDEAAKELGIDPVKLAAIISFETKGKFDPNLQHDVFLPAGKAGVVKPGFAKGLIGLTPDNWTTYHNKDNLTFREGLEGVRAYLRDRAARDKVDLKSLSLGGLYQLVNPGYSKERFEDEIRKQGHDAAAYKVLGINQNTPRLYRGAAPTDVVSYEAGFEGRTRNKPISATLNEQLSRAGAAVGVKVVIGSGGQGPEHLPHMKNKTGGWTGSDRHDHGNAADLDLIYQGRKLSFNNPADRDKISQFITHAVAAGATGVGAGLNYMGDGRIHVGGGKAGVWAAKGEQPLPWVKAALDEGMRLRASGGPTVATGGGNASTGTTSTTTAQPGSTGSSGASGGDTPVIDPTAMEDTTSFAPVTSEAWQRGLKPAGSQAASGANKPAGASGGAGLDIPKVDPTAMEDTTSPATATTQVANGSNKPAGAQAGPVFDPLTAKNPAVTAWRSRIFDNNDDIRNITGTPAGQSQAVQNMILDTAWKQAVEYALRDNNPEWLDAFPRRYYSTEKETKAREVRQHIEAAKDKQLVKAAAAAKAAREERQRVAKQNGANLMLNGDQEGYKAMIQAGIRDGTIDSDTMAKFKAMEDQIGWNGRNIIKDPEAIAATQTQIIYLMSRAVSMGEDPTMVMFDYVKANPSANIGGQEGLKTMFEKAQTLQKEGPAISSKHVTDVYNEIIPKMFGFDPVSIKSSPQARPQAASMWNDFQDDMMERMKVWRSGNHSATAPSAYVLKEMARAAAERIVFAYANEDQIKEARYYFNRRKEMVENIYSTPDPTSLETRPEPPTPTPNNTNKQQGEPVNPYIERMTTGR